MKTGREPQRPLLQELPAFIAHIASQSTVTLLIDVFKKLGLPRSVTDLILSWVEPQQLVPVPSVRLLLPNVVSLRAGPDSSRDRVELERMIDSMLGAEIRLRLRIFELRAKGQQGLDVLLETQTHQQW